MQFQADQLGVDVVRPRSPRPALGAAFAAGIAVGSWDGEQDAMDELEGGPALDAAGRRGRDGSAVPQLEEGRAADPGLVDEDVT